MILFSTSSCMGAWPSAIGGCADTTWYDQQQWFEQDLPCLETLHKSSTGSTMVFQPLSPFLATVMAEMALMALMAWKFAKNQCKRFFIQDWENTQPWMVSFVLWCWENHVPSSDGPEIRFPPFCDVRMYGCTGPLEDKNKNSYKNAICRRMWFMF